MSLHRAARWFGVMLTAVMSCREEVPISESKRGSTPPPTSFEQQLSFKASGLQPSFRSYTQVRASFDPGEQVTTIETLGDSLSNGKLIVRLRGNRTGLYRYSVSGSSTDVEELDMRFVSQYSGTKPIGIFELTESPLDSLEALVTISKFGAVGDNIVGTFYAQVKRIDAAPAFKILIHNGGFIVQRVE